MVTVLFFFGREVAILKLAELAPAATSTLAGTVATALFDDASTTVMPPVGAGVVRLTMPVDGVGPTTIFGDSTRLAKALAGGAVTVNAVLWLTPP